MTKTTVSTGERSMPVTDEAEMAVLGAVLLSGTVALPAIVEEGVQADDFRLAYRSIIFQIMREMHEDGDGIDRVTLYDRARRDGYVMITREVVDALASMVPNVGNLRQYARIVVRSSMWRTRASLLVELGEAAGKEDEDAYRRLLGRVRECELRFRPLLERDLSTP